MPAEKPKSSNALQIIFSFFLGLMVTAFIGVGVYTFYPQPEARYETKLQDLYRQQEDVQNFKEPSSLSDSDRAKLKRIQADIRELEDERQDEREIWGRNTSIILITFATIVMAISLIRADQLRIMSNGLLLGGLFTMIYGTGWIIATGTSKARFFVMLFALIMTIVLGYVRFVRERTPALVVASGVTGDAVSSADLEMRVAALEARAEAAARALGGSK